MARVKDWGQPQATRSSMATWNPFSTAWVAAAWLNVCRFYKDLAFDPLGAEGVFLSWRSRGIMAAGALGVDRVAAMSCDRNRLCFLGLVVAGLGA